MNILEQELFRKRETELVDDLAVLGGYIKNFWEILPLPICTTNPIFNILETSEAFNRFFGYFRDELMGDSLERLFVNEEYFKRLTQELFQKKRVADFKTTLRSKIGHTFTVLISAIVRLDENGDTVGYIFSFVDVTFIKQTERELQEKIEELAQRAKDLDESKNALINILEDVEEARILAEEEKNKTLALITNFSDGVLFFDSKNKLSLVNVTAQDFFGIRHNKIIGKYFGIIEGVVRLV